MCGIVGQVRTDGAPVGPALIAGMCAALEHRGPDSRGDALEPGVGLGIQRLRVIDLATGDQPIRNEDGTVVVVLNGEIYNYRELRERLRAPGTASRLAATPRRSSHLYEEDGDDCVAACTACSPSPSGTPPPALLVARDRVGKKPLFYAHRDGGLITFASELRRSSRIPRFPRIDHQALDCYLAYQYVPAPAARSAHVRKLPPAPTLTCGGRRASTSSATGGWTTATSWTRRPRRCKSGSGRLSPRRSGD